MWCALVESPKWYDGVCIFTSLALVVAGIVLHRAGQWVEGMILILSGVSSVAHRLHRLLDTMVPALFVFDLVFALMAGLVLKGLIRRHSCTWTKCLSMTTTVLMVMSWGVSRFNPLCSYCLHSVAHVIGVVVITSLLRQA